MKLIEIIEKIENRIPKKLAIKDDFIGLMDDYDLDQEIVNVYIMMDLYPGDMSKFEYGDLIITHHKPLFTPEIASYVLHSNWDVVDGGSNDALAEKLGLDVVDVFDKDLGIGRICKYRDNKGSGDLFRTIGEEFSFAQIVGCPPDECSVGVISGFGLKNVDYVRLARDEGVGVLISGDLTHEVAVLACNLGVCLVNLGHHFSEVPGLYALGRCLLDEGVDLEVIDEGAPWKPLNITRDIVID